MENNIVENVNNTLKMLYEKYDKKKCYIKICVDNNDFRSIKRLTEEITRIEIKIELLEDILEL